MAELAMIDAHQHCWQIDAVQWPTPELEPIYRDCTPEDFAAASRSWGIAGSVLVQSQPETTDTDYLLALAKRHQHVLGVVGWVALEADNAPEEIARRAREPAFCGIRPMLQNLPEDDWIMRPELAPALQALCEHGLSFDALVYPRHLPAIRRLAERYPALPIVLDHAAKPAIRSGQWADWHGPLAQLAAANNVCCKLSGLVTEASPGAELDRTLPYMEAVLRLFGPDRVIWGSDWPVVNLASNYGDWLQLCRKTVRKLVPEAESAIFCDNARRFYGLDRDIPTTRAEQE